MALLFAMYGMPSNTKEIQKGSEATGSVSTLQIIRQHYGVLLSIGLFSGCMQLVRSARRLLLTIHGHSCGLTPAQLSNMWAIAFMVDSITFPLAGMIMDKWGRKASGLPSMVIMGLSMAILPLTSSFFSIAGVACLGGFGNGLSAGLVMVLGADLAPPECRGEFLGVFRLISDFGFLVGPMVIGVVIDHFSTPFACGLTFAISLAASLLLMLCVRETLQTKR